MKDYSPNGPGFSPDGGHFWRKDGKLYWADGDITPDGGIMREMPPLPGHENGVPESEWHKYENYSAWSDEKRAAVLAAKKTERDAYKKEVEEEREQIKALCISAKAKLTKEEYAAIQWSRYSHEQPHFPWEDLP